MTGGPPEGVPPPIRSSPRVGLRQRVMQVGYDLTIGLVWCVAISFAALAIWTGIAY